MRFQCSLKPKIKRVRTSYLARHFPPTFNVILMRNPTWMYWRHLAKRWTPTSSYVMRIAFYEITSVILYLRLGHLADALIQNHLHLSHLYCTTTQLRVKGLALLGFELTSFWQEVLTTELPLPPRVYRWQGGQIKVLKRCRIALFR